MTTATYVTVESGKLRRKNALEASTGAPDADKIVQTTNTGRIDLTVQSAETYVHNQLSVSNSWSVSHPLRKFPSVIAKDSGGTQIEGHVAYIDENSLTISFSFGISGTAYLN